MTRLLISLVLVGTVAGASGARLSFNVLAEGKSTAARFDLKVNGVPWSPNPKSRNVVQFVSYHDSKRQLYVANYASGNGAVEISLPSAADRVEISIAKGLEYTPIRAVVLGADLEKPLNFNLKRWVNLVEDGWVSADAHIHYDRFSKRADPMWFTMMRGDDLTSAHFMYLIGGKVPGEWAVQYGYGTRGEATDGQRLITAGLEYRDGFQGHINLLGMPEIVQPVMAGRGNLPNYPTLDSVLRKTRKQGGLPTVAHGGSLGGKATVILDGVLGAPDAMEIGNSHLYSLDNWYRLMNAGFFYPPVAGTDLPNFPERDWWQPFLGGMRMYAQVGARRDFAAFKSAVKSGRVFVTSGPIIRFKVGGQAIGSTIRIRKPMELLFEGHIESPNGVTKLELIKNGEVTDIPIRTTSTGADFGIGRLPGSTNDQRFAVTIRKPIKISASCWLALRGRGVPIHSLKRAQLPPTPYHCSDAVAHTGVIRVIVGDQPIGTRSAKDNLAQQLRLQRDHYDQKARYETGAQKAEMLQLFDVALEKLGKQ